MTPAAQDALESCLKELERLGLARPASVLMTEYLAALTDEGLLDAEGARSVAAVYHRSRYGALDADDLELREAVAHLEQSAAAVGRLLPEERQSLMQRVNRRFGSHATRRSGQASAMPGQTSDFETALPPLSPTNWDEFGGGSSGRRDPFGADQGVLASESKSAHKRGGGVRIRSLPLEAAALIVLAVFFSGYFMRNVIDRAIDRNDPEGALSERGRRSPQGKGRSEAHWLATLTKQAEADVADKHDRSACLEYEILILSRPQDPDLLNQLAWTYLTSKDAAARDPKRGLELAQRAVALHRSANILDTVAEGYYQAGMPGEAVKLEQEALAQLRISVIGRRGSPVEFERQLKKFKAAQKAAAAAVTSAPRT